MTSTGHECEAQDDRNLKLNEQYFSIGVGAESGAQGGQEGGGRGRGRDVTASGKSVMKGVTM